MIFYRAVDADGLVHWVTVATEAKSIDPNYEQHDIGTDKSSLKELLNDFQQQLFAAQTGKEESLSSGETEALDSRPEVSPPPAGESYSEKSNRFEDEFDEFPLALKLHYASRAMECARHELPLEQRAIAAGIVREASDEVPA